MHCRSTSYRPIILSVLGIFLIFPSIGQHFTEASEHANLSRLNFNNGHAIADYDNDGDLDIFVVALESFDQNNEDTWSRLFRNNGFGQYTDVTIQAGFESQFTNPGQPGLMGQKMGASWGDFDNDGDPDLLLTHFRGVELYKNNGNGTFTDITGNSGFRPCPECYNNSALWWDYDNDGDIDLYLSDWVKKNRLYKNIGDGKFSDVSRSSGLDDLGSTWTSIPFDVNQDGWMDLYVVNDYSHNRLYLNIGGTRFEESTSAYGLEDEGDGMGVTIGDYNNDGLFDIYLTNIFFMAPNPLFKGTAEGKFIEIASTMDVENAGWAWGTHFFDCDLDGDEDLYVVNGFNYDQGTNKLFRNMLIEGQNTFIDWSEESATNGSLNAMSMEVFDSDNDGDLDIFVSNTDGKPYFYKNDVISNNQGYNKHWLKVELEGTASNRDAIGTVLQLWANGKSYHRFYHGAALLSQSLQPVHFGLNETDIVDSLIIKWPKGGKEVIHDISTNQTIRVVEFGNNDFSTITSLEEQSPFKEFRLINTYPNPIVENIDLVIETPSSGELSFAVSSIDGQLVYESKVSIKSKGQHHLSFTLNDTDLSQQKSAFYIYKMHFKDEYLSGKLIRK